MISYKRLFGEIERYALKARETENEQELRELLIAVRALCDVALNEPKHPAVTEQGQPQLYATGGNRFLPSRKIEDEDANGDSIFDF
jgi:hypothetical protein